ncbi:MAG: ROK family protein, partial [Clostridia bacterium]|nr:ROK family protein [Clostridia bacterium]
MYYIGIDLGGTNIAAGVVDGSHKIIKKKSIPTGASRPADEITADIAKLCVEVAKEASLTIDDIEYIGIATPGSAKCDTGEILYANNLPFSNYKMAEKLSSMLGAKKRVYIENDANAAAKAESVAGAAKGSKYSVMITLGTGVGGGIIIDGQVYCGFNFAGAELGHIVIKKDGRPCSCGRRGCWETYSSATGLVKTTREALESARAAGRKTVMEEMIGGDLSKIDDYNLDLLKNKELISINQDPEARPPMRLGHGDRPIFFKHLANNEYVLAFFNFGDRDSWGDVEFYDLGLTVA